MAFVSGFLLFLLFIVIVLALSFFGGVAFLVIGIITKNVNKKGKVFPVVSMIAGILLMLPAVISVGCVATIGGVSALKEKAALSQAQTLPETWRARSYMNNDTARSEAYLAVITAADSGDKEAFADCFAESVRSESDFDDRVDAFFEEYPGGLMDACLSRTGGTSSMHDGASCGTISYLGFKGDDWYIVKLTYCMEHDGHNDDIGVTSVVIRDAGTYAQYTYDYNESGGTLEDPYLLCDLDSEGEINARIIADAAILWNDDGSSPLSADETEEILNTSDTLQEAIDAGVLGEPQGAIKYYNNTGYYYYYEIEPRDGEPQYVHIVTSEPYGDIISAYFCTPEMTLYSDQIIEHDPEEG